ncbi:unnamed protein product [Closterium sp. NIES-54]
MVLAVANKTYDAAVGDITVLDSRSKFVFFTYPIQQSGLGVMGNSRPYSKQSMAGLLPVHGLHVGRHCRHLHHHRAARRAARHAARHAACHDERV